MYVIVCLQIIFICYIFKQDLYNNLSSLSTPCAPSLLTHPYTPADYMHNTAHPYDLPLYRPCVTLALIWCMDLWWVRLCHNNVLNEGTNGFYDYRSRDKTTPYIICKPINYTCDARSVLCDKLHSWRSDLFRFKSSRFVIVYELFSLRRN